ncbi:hypothetical protein [Cereibacter johrii]|uniref:Uncharacterized protein n=1 Tax=Cereibacter johrii TaxID=445629 RepID=A0ABX5J3R8_9RHOB|nr:hypothetical protein [Cereibacter johrii]ODM43331.1 hypothetical protein A9O63_07950 [Cereibacter johrii]PTM75596.1 hypothetical protein C8J29_11176 [Cereibacter johrii]
MLKPTATALLLVLTPLTGWAGQTVVTAPPEPLPDVLSPSPVQIETISGLVSDPQLAASLASAEPGSQEAVAAVASILDVYAARVDAAGGLPPMTAEEQATALELLNRIATLTGRTEAISSLTARLSP